MGILFGDSSQVMKGLQVLFLTILLAATRAQQFASVSEDGLESAGNNYGGYYVRGPQVDYYDQREDSRMKYPSMLGLGRVLFKRNSDIVTDPRFIKCLGDEGALGVPDVRIFAKCASFVGRPRFGKRNGGF